MVPKLEIRFAEVRKRPFVADFCKPSFNDMEKEHRNTNDEASVHIEPNDVQQRPRNNPTPSPMPIGLLHQDLKQQEQKREQLSPKCAKPYPKERKEYGCTTANQKWMCTAIASASVQGSGHGEDQEDPQYRHSVESERADSGTPVQYEPRAPFMMDSGIDGRRESEHVANWKWATLGKHSHQGHFVECVMGDGA